MRDTPSSWGKGTRVENRKRSVSGFSAQHGNHRPSPSLGSWVGIGAALDAGEPSAHLPFPPPLVFAAAGGGSLRSDPPRSGRGVAHCLPQANFEHFRVSLLCKLQAMGRIEELRTPGTVSARTSRALRRTSSFSLRPRRSPGTKAATPRPRRPGRGGGALVVCAPPPLSCPRCASAPEGPGVRCWDPGVLHPHITTA